MIDDPEVNAMAVVFDALSELDDEDARGRVLRWAMDRYVNDRDLAAQHPGVTNN